MIKSVVKNVGNQALSPEDNLVVLFNTNATPNLSEFCVLQEVEENASFDLSIGDAISFDDQTYTIKFVGPLANRDLNDLSHTSIFFQEVPTDNQIANALYVEPHKMPIISEGTVITFS
ncbi:PTS glucitol/sorbitol transporter subunit IIA [Vagococcus vulneris]|uniref:PTS sorbitol transporter subunit IIA n=1 Tax=Vagococcus vulneris TaxID=1977869 RepID=A0A429ZX20_9ENTE|nr:PTS glucitol/sorbitol transporter subunit IIA [Vagococcus vulneris]RST98206.1 hypothetical protein CBF37_08535 [Vagococcus vulneris]